MSEWIDQKTAADILNLSRDAFAHSLDTISRAVDSKPVELTGLAKITNRRTAWSREDCERLARIMRRCSLTLSPACKVLAALEKDGPL